MLAASTNCDFTSCYEIGHEYEGSPVANTLDNCSLIVFTHKDKQASHDWPKKTGRTWFYVTGTSKGKLAGIITAGRYGNINESDIDQGKRYIMRKLADSVGAYRHWTHLRHVETAWYMSVGYSDDHDFEEYRLDMFRSDRLHADIAETGICLDCGYEHGDAESLSCCVGSYHCSECEERVHEDDVYTDDNGNDYCSCCYHETYSRCECCESEIPVDDAYCHDGMNYCESCFSDHFGYCDECGETFPIDELQFSDQINYDGHYCDHCYKEGSEQLELA